MTDQVVEPHINFRRPNGEDLLVGITGCWRISETLPLADEIREQLASSTRTKRIIFETRDLKEWDSGLLAFLIALDSICAEADIRMVPDGLPQGVRRLLSLASAVPEKTGTRTKTGREPFLDRLGAHALAFLHSAGEMVAFIGEASLALVNLIRGKARYRRTDLILTIQDCGADALPIVTLISFLVGLILAFVGVIQLRLFGAQIYVADLVGIGMVREMGAIMTGIVMAGRSGGAFAAQLGTMETNEEIDALRTLGISPMEFLVLPRMLALALMMPLLCLYANLMGILGGAVVGVGLYDLNVVQYYNQTTRAVGLNDLWIGLFMGGVFGILVALSGCMRGMQCGRSASAVGDAATSAVVTAIVSIIVATALITIVCDVLGI